MKAGEVYITRLGDMGSYEEHDDLETAIACLKDNHVSGPLYERLGYGFTSAHYQGQDYISFYVSQPGSVEMERSLKAGEVRKVLKAFQ